MDSLKIIIPMAGLGTRLRPHTWSKPKPLVSVAGMAVLGHVLEMFSSLSDTHNTELVFIVGYLGDQAEEYIHEHYPHLKTHFVVQEEMRGQSHALLLAREHLQGPGIIVFVDTLIETDLSFVRDPEVESVTCVKPVEDPRRFGVAEVGEDGYVRRLVEKPQDMENNLAIVGFYYFREAERLLQAIEQQIEEDVQLKGEYFLADAVNIMLQNGLKMKTQMVDIWLDAGTSETLLETNRYLLDNNRDNSDEVRQRPGLVVVPPVYVHSSAVVENSVIGPHVSIGANCQIRHSIIRDSIFEEDAMAESVILERSLVGRKACISRRPGIINAGDQTEVML
jgi:glucose-1-phosphate thymidylyltransferase